MIIKQWWWWWWSVRYGGDNFAIVKVAIHFFFCTFDVWPASSVVAARQRSWGKVMFFPGVCQSFCLQRMWDLWSYVLSRGISGTRSILGCGHVRGVCPRGLGMSGGRYSREGWVCPGGGYPLPQTWDLGYNRIRSASSLDMGALIDAIDFSDFFQTKWFSA